MTQLPPLQKFVAQTTGIECKVAQTHGSPASTCYQVTIDYDRLRQRRMRRTCTTTC